MTNSKKEPSTNSDSIIAWLKAHPLISRHALCQQVGYNSANLKNAIEGKRSLPETHAQKIAAVLKNYGYPKS